MINIFKRKTSIKDIELFELKVAELVYPEFPQIKEHLTKSKLSIRFWRTTISISKRGDLVINNNERNFFELSGIYLIEKKTKREKEIKLFYLNNVLDQIEVENSKTFYKNFDFNSITKRDLKIRNIEIQNPDIKIVSKILSSLNKQQLELLDLENTFEIELDDKFYYPIIDMESGNYIAVDKKGKIYRLNHDHIEIAKEIFNNANDFLNAHNGVKLELEVYFE